MIRDFKVATPERKAKGEVFLHPGPRTAAAQMHVYEASPGSVEHRTQRLTYRGRSRRDGFIQPEHTEVHTQAFHGKAFSAAALREKQTKVPANGDDADRS